MKDSAKKAAFPHRIILCFQGEELELKCVSRGPRKAKRLSTKKRSRNAKGKR